MNPVWRDVSRLDSRRQWIAACLITGYGACRYQINESLLDPLNRSRTLLPDAISQEIKELLIDEALIALLKSCNVPESDPTGKLPNQIVQNLAEMWGVFALADSNHRLKRTKPDTLKGSSYSSDPDEARMQVLVKWAEILGITQSNFVMDVNRQWFLEEWKSMSAAMLAGMLAGFGRTPDEIVFKKARSEAASVPEHRLAATRYMIQTLAKVSSHPPIRVSPKRKGAHGDPVRAREILDRAAKAAPSLPQYGVDRQPDGKVAIKIAPSASQLDVTRSLIASMLPLCAALDADVCSRWVSEVTSESVDGSQWTAAQLDVLLRGYERLLWDGSADYPLLTDLVRKEYPELKGSRIDLTLTDEIRSVFRSWTAMGSRLPRSD